MKDFYTERKALQDYISWIKEERRRLGEEYWKAIDRLKELDENENGLDKPVDLIEKLIDVVGEQANSIETLKRLTPKIDVKSVADECEPERKVTSGMVEAERDEVEKAQPKKKNITMDRKEMGRAVASYLKERGVPVSTKEIGLFIEERRGRKLANVAELLTYIMNIGINIERVSRGFYQYKM